MKKIVLSVMAVVLSRLGIGAAGRSLPGAVPEPPTPGAGAADGMAPGAPAEAPCRIRAAQVTVH